MIRFKVMMSLLSSCSIVERRVSSRSFSRPNSKSSGHTKVGSHPPFKPHNRSCKNSRCLLVKSKEERASRKGNEPKRTEQDESENGKHAFETQAKRIMKSKLHWVKVHPTTIVFRLSSPNSDGR